MVIIFGLKTYLKNNPKARRIFGKKELEIIFKQIEGMPLSQSERNRVSRDIKPKLQCIAAMAAYKDEFTLERNQDNKRLIQQAVQTMLQDPSAEEIQAILLFGSFADNTFTPRSDIDLCVLFTRQLSRREATQFRIRVAGQLPDKVDVQVFHVLPQKVKRSIARNHKILYKTKEYDNIQFSIQYLKDEDYFIRRKYLEMGA